jgi:hypothetical protein
MKARTPTPLFDQALTAPLRTLTPTPLPEGEGATAPPRTPSPQKSVERRAFFDAL